MVSDASAAVGSHRITPLQLAAHVSPARDVFEHLARQVKGRLLAQRQLRALHPVVLLLFCFFIVLSPTFCSQ